MKFVLALAVALAVALPVRADSPEDLARQLPSLTGLERAHALTQLVDELRNDSPRKAVDYGMQALALYATHPDARAQARTLNEMAWAYMVAGDYDHAVSYAEQGRDLAKRGGDQSGLARAINNLGVIAQRRGDPLAAIDAFERSLAIYRTLKDTSNIAGELNNLGFVYSTQLADYEKALTNHLEALKVREQLGDRAAVALSLNNIGIVYERLGEYDRALEYYNRALAIRQALGGQPNRIAAILNNIGDVHLERGDSERALQFHQRALALRRQVGDRSGVAISLKNLGSIYAASGQLDLAHRSLEEGLDIANAVGDQGTAAMCLLGLAAVNRRQGDAPAAMAQARRALEIAQQTSANELIRQGWHELSAAQEAGGHPADALASYKHFKEADDRIFDEEKSRRQELLQQKYQAERRDTEIERLKREEAVKALEASGQRMQRNAIAAVAVAALVLAIALYRRRVAAARLAAELSVTDPLTALKNRRYVQQMIAADLAACDRKHARVGPPPSDGDLVFMIVDIDQFKSVNDQYGHRAGDAVLEQIAARLKEICRASDTVVRWGGEEFLIIHRFTDRRTAGSAAERIRAGVATQPFNLGDGRHIHRTCSVGFASYPFSRAYPHTLTWEHIVGIADEALYIAKASGPDAWVGLSASEQATPVQLQRRTREELMRGLAEGTLLIETSRDQDQTLASRAV
jgi:diguanylate cyclase (GGDEF)-like protein